jgi:hypothetical protein
VKRAVRIGTAIGLLSLLALGRLTYDAPPTEPLTYEECAARNIVCY